MDKVLAGGVGDRGLDWGEATIPWTDDGDGVGLGHKLEQAVDLESGAVVGVTVQTTDGGDVASLTETLDETERRNLACPSPDDSSAERAS